MIKPLTDYVTERTPFLRRVKITGEPAGIKGVGKAGFGPRITNEPGSAEEAERMESLLISSYIDSWIRGQLYLFACVHGFQPLDGCPCLVIPQDEQTYPLRADADGKTINPMIVTENSAQVNPEWLAAPKEFFFGVAQDVLRLDGNVSRALRGDHYAFKIDLALHVPRGSVCVEIRDRVLPFDESLFPSSR